jgi:hypothetical protein
MSGLAVWLVGTQVFWAGVLQKTQGPGVTQKLQRINSKFGNGKGNTQGESENSLGVRASARIEYTKSKWTFFRHLDRTLDEGYTPRTWHDGYSAGALDHGYTPRTCMMAILPELWMMVILPELT